MSNDKYMNDIRRRFIDFASELGYEKEIDDLCKYHIEYSSIIAEDIEEYLE